MDYVNDQTLCLQSYTLSIGHCNALARSLEHFQGYINKIILDNCGVDDEEMSKIIEGLKKLKACKKLVYRYNIFMHKSLVEIEDLLAKKLPNNLEELRIENCRIEQGVTRQLMKMLKRSSLRKLSLVNANLLEDSFEDLCQFVDDANYLQEIDVSWNKLRPISFYRLLDIIAKNNQLMYLNLSYNQLFDNTPEPKKEEEPPSKKKKDEVIISEEDYVKDQYAIFNEELAEKAKVAIENLVNFIKKNKFLIHADLSFTGLSEKQLWYFGRAMRRSFSLRALHLSGNPGITPRLKQYLSERAHCMPEEPENFIALLKLPSLLKIDKSNEEKNVEHHKETNLIKQIVAHKRTEQNSKIVQDTEKETLIFTRLLGHKDDIIGGGQWKMITDAKKGHNECWVCDRKIYSIIFWNKEIGLMAEAEVPLEDQKFLVQNIERINPREDDLPQNDLSHPLIYGQFTNWKPRRMFEIREFCDRINNYKPNIFAQCQRDYKIREECETIEDLEPEEFEYY